uniref:fibrocystin-L-like n=1 Tax=Styela clava TaxID=7725 RepID=UPI00193AC945
MGGTDFHVLKLLILISVIKIISVGGYSLNNFYPPWGGSNGATPVRLHGEFTINPFNTGVGPEIPELKVFFIGEHQVFEAEVEKDSTKEHVIGCYTRPMPVGKYKICVEIEGDQYCKSTFHVVWWRTPYIAEFHFSADHDSFAGTPRSLLTVDGRIFTDVYGTNDIRMLGSAEELTIRRVYAGSEDCSLVDENDDLYGLQLDSEGSWDGEFTCKMNSEYVGNNNFSFIVTGYGRSKVNENLMRITGEDKIYMFQTYAEVTGISPQSGSEEGGTIITVSGRYFDPNPTKDTHVWVGRELCEIIEGSQTDTELKCITPSKPSIMELYPGSRGVNVEVWYDTQMNLDDARVSLNSTHDGYDTWEADSAGYSFENVTTIVKITGTFEVPVDDKYQFYIRSDDGSVLYLSCDGNSANVEKVAYASSYAPHFRHFSSQKSDWMDLDKGQFCYFEGLVQNYQGPGNIYIGVLRATTTLTSAQSANAWMERQQILWQAQEKKEKQVISLINWNPETPLSEVQTVEVSSNCYQTDFPDVICASEFYVLSYRGRHTNVLSVNALDFDVQEALNKIMPTDDVEVSVTSTPMLDVNGNEIGTSYEVTFSGYMGDEPALVVEHASANVTVEVSEDTKGSPNFLKFSLNFLGRITDAIRVDATAEDVQEALWKAREAKCVDELMKLSSLFIREFLHFEGNKPSDYSESGKRTKNMDAFCGSSSLLNPHDVFDSGRDHFSKYSVEEFPYFCFAHKGLFLNKLSIKFEYVRPSDGRVLTPEVKFFENDIVMTENAWSYSCFNIEEAIKEHDDYMDAQNIKILRLAGFQTISNQQNFYIDEVLITRTIPDDLEDIVIRRQPPAMYQGEVISSIEVEKLESNHTEFEITFSPYNCAHDLPLLSVVNAPMMLEQSVDASQYNGIGWPVGTVVNVTRTQKTNIPVGGTFDISYDDDELGLLSYSGIPGSIALKELEAILESMGLGDMKVWGHQDYCYSRRILVEWVANGGDKKMFDIDDTNIQGEEDLQFHHYFRNGGALHAPFGGDMTRRMYSESQVEVLMNGIHSRCDGDCSFSYSNALTPVLTSSSPSSGSNPTPITIVGTNLDESSSGSEVLINGVECTITSHTSTEIICTTGSMEYGDHDIIVRVGGKGYGTQPDPALSYTQLYSVSSISPSSSFTPGGIFLTLTGVGLSSSLSVEINFVDCPVVSASPTTIQCVVPPSSTEASYSVELITNSGTRTTVGTFEYSNAGMPVVTSISGENIMGPGGTSVILSGSNFGTVIDDILVTIGGQTCEILNLSDTSIECTSPYLSSGTYSLEVLLTGLGAADLGTNSIPDIVYTFIVTDIQPRMTSLFGGQTLELTGNGFLEDTTVSLGYVDCEVTNIMSTSLSCTLGSTAQIHYIYNEGSHADFGFGYAWLPDVMTIVQGDTVVWDWYFPEWIDDIDGIEIFETSVPDGLTHNGGFLSGYDRTLTGTFSHTFTSVGTFYYSSGYVDDEDYGSILMSGTINVVALSDISLGLEVQNNGISAEINLVTNDGITKRGAPCVPLNAGIDGCAPSRKKRDIGIRSRTKRGTGSIVTITEDYKNQFLHSHNNARSNAYPQGSNIILMEWNDEIAANAESYAEQCTWGHSTSASRVTSDHGQLGENLAIYTRGNSLSNIANAAVVDWADEVAFYNFSTLSCQDTEVCGHYTQVIWDDSYALGCAIADCEEADIENDPFTDAEYQGAYYIVCQYGPGGNFNPSTNPPYDEGVPCSNCPAEFPACDSTYTLCAKETGGGGDGNGDGDVTASVCFTPTITSISPQFGTVDDVITIEGTGFGDDSCRISVVIGDDISCTVNSSTTTTITCTPNPNAGANIGISYEVIVNVLGYGDAFVDIPTDADKRFALLPSISSITPATGSLAGGTYIDILGTGFMDDVTSVNIGGDDCEIISQDYVSINCKTSSGSQGSQTVGVVVNSYQAVCLSSCDFLFDVSVTPSVSSIEPNSVSSENTAIHITGTGFDGDSSDVMIGDSTCVIDSINATHIECTIAELIAGNFETKVHISPKGYADFEASNIVTGESIATLSATSGSVFGGSVFTIAGHGFNSDDLSVTFDGSDAEIMLKMNKLLLVKTPPGTAGNKDVVIVSNGVTYPTLQFTYDAALTPLVTSILPTSGGVGTTVTITGTMLNATASTNEVKIGDAICTITSETATEIQCSTGEPSIGGEKEITVFVGGHGNADTTSVTFTYDMEISSFSPVEGSYGGENTITITGSGFSSDATVHVGYSICEVDSVVYGSISCTLEETPSLVARDDAIESFEVLLNSFDITVFNSLPRDDYQVIGQYASDCINCDTLISNLPTYRIGNGDALMNPVSYNQIMTNGAAQISVWEPVPPSDSYVCLGSFIVTGTSPPELDATACIHYMLVEESTPTLELDATTLYIWSITDSPFVLYTASSTPPTVYKLKDMSQAMSNMQYPITIDNDGTEVMSATNFTFKSALTPVVTSVTPTRGGTGGGTPITITGTGFSVDTADVSVTIGGVVCDVTSTSLTTIECTTNSRNGSIETAVIVNIAGKGQSLDIGAKFYYIDLWSSIWTWGGRGIPGDDTFIVIPAGMEIMIDENTAILKMLLIQGGKVFFDEADIELNAKNILITDGGVLQVGTEDEPFQHKAIITLHGHLRSIELPIYGTKTIAVRDGMLDLHGKYVPVTWTYLSATANAGTNVITVDNPVTWEAGDEIVIASTGHRHSQEENEKHTILSVAGDQVTITLETALEFDHLGVVETMPDGTVLKSRAEVGLLTHNVLVRGSRNMDWSEDIPACPEGFNTGEFAQQTCFQGRFGEEMGSDQFGGQIMFHHPSPDEQKAFGRISYVELNYMGQAFRLGRYAIHYHLMGDMNYKNYVRGCGIHETFNRAVTIHDTHKALVEKNVIFNSMGGTIFIEDGLETKNKIIGNLVVFCRQSTSLQNDDVTPAAFWITNADNIVEDNAAAGGTHFGYWFRMHKHPSGPSHTTSICPRKVALGSFSNNTAHSQGWFGVWIFQEFTPKSGSCCWCDQNEIAVLTGLEVWNCEKGAEFVQTGSVKISDSKFYNNDKAGVEVKMMKPLVWGETGLENSV